MTVALAVIWMLLVSNVTLVGYIIYQRIEMRKIAHEVTRIADILRSARQEKP